MEFELLKNNCIHLTTINKIIFILIIYNYERSQINFKRIRNNLDNFN